MPDLIVHLNVEIDGLTINIDVEGGRDLATMDPLAAAAAAVDRAARGMAEALRAGP